MAANLGSHSFKIEYAGDFSLTLPPVAEKLCTVLPPQEKKKKWRLAGLPLADEFLS